MALPPPRTTELFYDGAWHPAKVRDTSSVRVKRGVGAEGNRPDPATASMVLDNLSGAYAPHNPGGSLYGKIGRNTPWRFGVHAGTPRLDLPGAGGDALVAADHPALGVTGDFDLRMDVTVADDWRRPRLLAARYRTVADDRAWGLLLDAAGRLLLTWSPTGTLSGRRTLRSTAAVPTAYGLRIHLRVALDIDDGAGGCGAAFYWARPGHPAWRQLGETVVSAGTTSVYDGIAPLEIGASQWLTTMPDGTLMYPLRGLVHSLQLRDGPALKVDLDFTAAADGDVSFTDLAGLVWTATGAATLTNLHTRMVGEIPAWPVSRDLSGADRTVTIAPAGIMRRLGAGNKPLDSALRRYILGASPLECWPLTDGAEARWGASLVGGPRLLPQATSGPTVKWAAGAIGDWVEDVAAITAESDGALAAALPRRTAADAGWAVDIFRSGTGVDTGTIITDWGTGSTADPEVTWTLITELDLFQPDAIRLTLSTRTEDTGSDSSLTLLPNTGLHDGHPHHLRLEVEPDVGFTWWRIYLDGVQLAESNWPIDSKGPRSIRTEWNPTFATVDTTDVSLGYITVWGPDYPPAAAVFAAYMGVPGETAGTRVLRVCAERGVPASMLGDEADGTRLGIQRPEKFLDTLNTVAATDLGYVLERRDALALYYRGRHTLYNQEPVLVLDFTAGLFSDPFRPIDDDKLTENDVTVKRAGGTSSTAVLENGSMSILDPPDGVGRYDVERTLSLEADWQTGEHAYWRRHLGTYEGLRYPTIRLDLGNPRVYALIDAIYQADVGDLLRIENLPDDYGGGHVDLIIRGYTEDVGPNGWMIEFTCEPGAPWAVGIVGDPTVGRADTDGSELAAAVTSTGTSWSVAVTAGPRWIDSATYPAMFPFSVTCGGEEATVTAITGTSSPQTFTVVRAVNGIDKPQAAGTGLSLTHPMRAAL